MYYFTREELLSFDIDSLDVSFYHSDDFKRFVEEDDEDSDEYRFPFWRDYQRLISSPAYRRLKDKTQLFPGTESDFFRCRLTHSQEVSHIGKSISRRLNMKLANIYTERGFTNTHQYFSFIDTDLVEFACLAHDLGHPPFGHQGEEELNLLMKEYGGFEGNAQTLRIIARLEKKITNSNQEGNFFNSGGYNRRGLDMRCGLNPTYRGLASILKYDKRIASKVDEVEKGYYETEHQIVNRLKERIGTPGSDFKTVECQIMDIADDIAYSVYDLEDSLKGGFIDPLDFLSVPEKILDNIANQINNKHRKEFRYKKILNSGKVKTFLEDFVYRFVFADPKLPITVIDLINKLKEISKNGYGRTQFISRLISYYISCVEIEFNVDNPALSIVYIKDDEDAKTYLKKRNTFLEIEILKRFNYEFQINSPRLKIVEHRGREIVSTIFKEIVKSEGNFLPPDVRDIYTLICESVSDRGEREKKCLRVICDFVAGMTDSYALEYYGRLRSENAKSIYKPM